MKTDLIDTHCHLDMEPFDKDREEVIHRAVGSDIKYMINAGSDRDGNLRGLELSDSMKMYILPSVFIPMMLKL